jgi:hypothetical protein
MWRMRKGERRGAFRRVRSPDGGNDKRHRVCGPPVRGPRSPIGMFPRHYRHSRHWITIVTRITCLLSPDRQHAFHSTCPPRHDQSGDDRALHRTISKRSRADNGTYTISPYRSARCPSHSDCRKVR